MEIKMKKKEFITYFNLSEIEKEIKIKIKKFNQLSIKFTFFAILVLESYLLKSLEVLE